MRPIYASSQYLKRVFVNLVSLTWNYGNIMNYFFEDTVVTRFQIRILFWKICHLLFAKILGNFAEWDINISKMI